MDQVGVLGRELSVQLLCSGRIQYYEFVRVLKSADFVAEPRHLEPAPQPAVQPRPQHRTMTSFTKRQAVEASQELLRTKLRERALAPDNKATA